MSARGAEEAGNWITNPQFSQWSGNGTARWAHATKQPWALEQLTDGPAATAVRVDIKEARGGSLGEIRQTVKVRPNIDYRASVDVKGTTDGLALMMIKLRKRGKELKRIPVTGSTQQWSTLTETFNTTDADEVQLLCRYSQRPEAVGMSVWFTNVSLVALDGSAPIEKPQTATDNKPKFDPATVVAAPAADQYVTPTGAGDGSGHNWDNARSAANLQQAIDAAGSGNTVFIGSGTYDNVALVIAAGGSAPDRVLTIAGHDTGGGRPVFRSTFDKSNPAKTGKTLFSVNPGVSHLAISNLQVEKYRQGVALKGSNTNIAITDVDVLETRDAFWIEGGGVAGDADSGSRQISLTDCDVTYFTKRAVRIFNGVSDVQITNCHVDAGGKGWATEPFAIGFQVIGGKGGVVDRNITFTDCSASSAWHDGGDKYWNADGFATERAVEDVTWIRCRAFSNTDGGWDLKNVRPTLIDCIGIGNKRNFRIWLNGDKGPAKLENCLSAFSVDYGSLGHDVGFWLLAGGEATLKNCTAWGDRLALRVEGKKDPAATTELVLDHCLINPVSSGRALQFTEGTSVENPGTVIAGEDTPMPTLKSPSSTWRGGDDSFDVVGESTVGYRHSAAAR